MQAAPQIRTHEDLMALEAQVAQLRAQVMGAARLEKQKKARNEIIPFVELMMPTPDEPENPEKSRYEAKRHHRAIAAALEEVEAGRILRLIINCPPRHGKSQLSSRVFPAWFVGRDPYRSVALATYNDTFAQDFGREVREIMLSSEYRAVFPDCRLMQGSKASDRLATTRGGRLHFVGAGGSLTGRGADVIIIDDPIKDAEEAASATIRDKRWDWFTKVVLTRLLSSVGRIVIIQTRWHEDDLVGRLTNPESPYYSEDEARKWKVIDLPALALHDDPLGRAVEEPLWPERFTFDFLDAFRRIDPKGFSALYQGRPSPEEGDEFKASYIRAYLPKDLPKNLRYYAASDHAVSQKQHKDPTVLLIAGVDERDNVWIIDVWWKREPTDKVVEQMLWMMKKYKPQMWWAEEGHISKAFGPFLRKRMRKERVMCAIDERTPVKDKRTRAQAIKGWMALGKVYFPRLAPWYAAARSELLKFPDGAHDDFVDALAHLGMGLETQWQPGKPRVAKGEYAIGTLGWLKQQSAMTDREAKRQQIVAVM